MEFRSHHMALVAYTAVALVVIAKDIVTDPLQIIALLAPIAGMFTWGKLKQTSTTE